jgi:DNA-binding PadR family transcriptional regulator
MNTKLLPLALLEANETEPIEGITRFMKLVFLAQQETLQEEFYEYEAGQYGPYSKSLYDDIDRLESRGFIERTDRETTDDKDDEQVYALTEKGKRTLKQARNRSDAFPAVLEDLNDVKSRYNSMDLWELLEYVYGEYPEMARNSVLDIATGKAA